MKIFAALIMVIFNVRKDTHAEDHKYEEKSGVLSIRKLSGPILNGSGLFLFVLFCFVF